MTQSKAGFESEVKDQKIGTVLISSLTDAKKGVSYYVNVAEDGTTTITTTATTPAIDPTSGK